MIRISLNRAIVVILAAAIVAGLAPAGAVLSRRLASALEARAIRDLTLAPQILAARSSAVADAMMMHAKEFSHEPALLAALQFGDTASLRRSVSAAQQTYGEAMPVVVAADGRTIAGPTPDTGLVAETRRGHMPVRISVDGRRLHNMALAPVNAGPRWLGAAGFASPLDERAAGALAGLTRSQVILTSGDAISATTMDSATSVLLVAELERLPPDTVAREVSLASTRYVVMQATLGNAGRVFFVRALADELSVLPALQRVALASAAAGLVIALVLGAMLASRVSRPARQLATAASDLAQGSFDAPLPRTRVLELSQLAAAFDSMRRSLATRLEELRLANAALADRNTRLIALQGELMQRDRLESSGRLVAQLAHEIRNPVASLRNCLEIIRRRVEHDEKAREFADVAIDELLRMHELAEQMLDLQRPRNPATQHCDPAVVAREVVRLATAGLGDEELAVRVITDGPASAAISADALKQVFLNLVQNARDASPGRGTRVDITITSDDAGVRIDVCDDGPGVAEQLWPRVFDPFFTTKDSVRGVGLGLFVGEGLVRTIGGRISLEPPVSAADGAHFRIELPRARGPLGRDEQAVPRDGAAQ